jgi:hypothetical protein
LAPATTEDFHREECVWQAGSFMTWCPLRLISGCFSVERRF